MIGDCIFSNGFKSALFNKKQKFKKKMGQGQLKLGTYSRCKIKKRTATRCSQKRQLNTFLKVPKCEIFDLLFFALINPILVGHLGARKNKFFILKIEADILHLVFFTHAECALKNVLRMLSMR